MNVRVNLNYTIYDGAEIVFKAPCDASEVTGLIVYYPVGTEEVSSVFAFTDAHTNDLGNIDNLFAKDAVVKVIIDTETSMAFVQNAATNAYLEDRFARIGGGLPPMTVTIASGKANHTATEIYDAVQDGRMVVLQHYENYLILQYCSADIAAFVYTADDAVDTVIMIDEHGEIEETDISYAPLVYVNEIAEQLGDMVKTVNGIEPDENGNVEIDVGEPEDATLTNAQASAQLGNELLTADGWTTTGWTGSLAEGFTHTSGNTNPLSFAMPSGITGKRYQVSFACSTEITTNNLKVRIGNSDLFELYGQFGVDVQGGVGITAVDNSPLEFIPSSTFTGRIYNISVKEITDISEPYFEVADETGNVAFQARFSDPERDNVFFGTNAGRMNTSGKMNFGLGFNALRDNTSGFWNTAIGARALEGNSVGSRNIAIGYVSLLRNTTGHRNICLGTYTMQNNTTGHHNIAIGADVLDLNETGYNHVAIGFGALRNTVNSRDCVGVGYSALSSNTTGFENTAVGAMAGYELKTAQSCTAVGSKALKNNNGTYCTAVGAEAGATNQTGIRNTYIGKGADATGSYFNDCIAIGQGAKVSKSGQTMIGGTNTTETVVKGNFIVQGTDGIKRQIVFNADGTCSWTTV